MLICHLFCFNNTATTVIYTYVHTRSLHDALPICSYSRLCIEEAARLLRLFGCETRIFDPSTLPLPDQVANDDHPAVHELRALSLWSEGQVWCSPERHGQISGIMKTQIEIGRAHV